MRIGRSLRFERDWETLPAAVRRQAEKQIRIFIDNPRHPSLRVGKLSGTDVFYGRINRDYRFTFSREGDVIVLRRIGQHKVIESP